MSTFHERLRTLRLSKKIMSKTMAEMLQMNPRSYRFYEAGTSEPPFSKLIFLADYFNVSTDYLLGRTDNPKVTK